MKFLLDSVIVIDHLNDVQAAADFLGEHSAQCAISTITRAEVLVGIEHDRPLVIQLLETFPFLALDAAIADETARIRQRHRLKLPDAFQLAVARAHGLTLVTRNSKDFPVRKFAEVLLPYRI